MKQITKEIKDYLPYYIGCEVMAPCMSWDEEPIAKGILTGIHGEYEAEIQFIIDGNVEESPDYAKFVDIKPILRKLSSMTEEEFQDLARSFFNDEKLTFGTDGSYWYACSREIDPEFEGEVIEHINEACDDDPENVIMCCIRTKTITYGWITYEEMYHGLSTTEQAEVFQYLLSKGFDLFGLLESGLAIEKDSGLALDKENK